MEKRRRPGEECRVLNAETAEHKAHEPGIQVQEGAPSVCVFPFFNSHCSPLVSLKGLYKKKVQEAGNHGIEGAAPPHRLPPPPRRQKRHTDQGDGGSERKPDIQYAEGYGAVLEVKPVGDHHGGNDCHEGQANTLHEAAHQHQPDMRAERPYPGAKGDKADGDGPRRPAAEFVEDQTSRDGEGDACHGKDGHEQACRAAAHLEGADEEGHDRRNLVIVQGPREAGKEDEDEGRPRCVSFTAFWCRWFQQLLITTFSDLPYVLSAVPAHSSRNYSWRLPSTRYASGKQLNVKRR
ncbi:MAG: hypothetical protein A2167_07945 [Planctomycetes bacterium RBG_13_46_10]|nr:MAG: hypothetical protein A2167_07945 [Planctomycetes bacterium RBG_13_46_10]